MSISHSASAAFFCIAPCPHASPGFFLRLSASHFRFGGTFQRRNCQRVGCGFALCGTWKGQTGSYVPACGAICSKLSADVRCSEGVPTGGWLRSQGRRSPAVSTAQRNASRKNSHLGRCASPVELATQIRRAPWHVTAAQSKTSGAKGLHHSGRERNLETPFSAPERIKMCAQLCNIHNEVLNVRRTRKYGLLRRLVLLWQERNSEVNWWRATVQMSEETSNFDIINRHIQFDAHTRETSTPHNITSFAISGLRMPIGKGLSVLAEDRFDSNGAAKRPRATRNDGCEERLGPERWRCVVKVSDFLVWSSSRRTTDEMSCREDLASLQKRVGESALAEGICVGKAKSAYCSFVQA